MKSISFVTKRDVIDLFKNGIIEEGWFGKEITFYPYYGRFTPVDFLERIYKLDTYKNKNFIFENIKQEVLMHMHNGKYSDDWIFNDKRVDLIGGEDSFFLNFLCEVFHPEVRDESKNWKKYLERINSLLREDEYELVSLSKISGREVFTWRTYIEKPDIYIPFSERNKSLKQNKKINIKISDSIKYQLFKVMDKYNEIFIFKSETGLSYYKSTSELVFQDILNFYTPKYFIKNKLVVMKEFDDFKENTSPFVLFDVIESFSRNTTKSKEFENRINAIFNLHNMLVEIRNGEIYSSMNRTSLLDSSVMIKEVGLENLVRKAEDLYSKGKYSYAVEKIWDAFERIKTYYYPALDKKRSVEKIIKDISYGNKSIEEMFDVEFKKMTQIGNLYQIRHHEIDKINISSELHYKYLYKRCLVLLSIIIEYLQ